MNERRRGAVAHRRVGAPLLVSILLALSAIAVAHAPPTGPIGLLLLAGAVALLGRTTQTMSQGATLPQSSEAAISTAGRRRRR